MGLDQYLRGRKFLWHNWEHPNLERKEDGFRIGAIDLDLGYWRKHPDLHGYIVQTFAKGEDKCQEIELDADDIRKIMDAIDGGKLVHTSGPFFGQSEGSAAERRRDLEVFERALAWMEQVPPPPKPELISEEAGVMAMYRVDVAAKPAKESRYVIYQASW